LPESKGATKAAEQFLDGLKHRNPHEDEFHQAVEEVVDSVMPWYLDHPEYGRAKILERLTEPDRIISFRVAWQRDSGETEVNRAWRVQFNHMLGPYKGGLRFHPSVDQSVLKFLGFEQTLKNSLTGLPMGGAKGGSNFNPKGKSDAEVMRFCQSMMTELSRHIGEDVDVPAGDIGVGAREISYLFSQYVRLQNRWAGVMTGKRTEYGGSALRPEATGYGCVYFCEEMLKHHDESLDGKRIAISGSGNVALFAAEKAIQKGARVVTLSDSDGLVQVENGISEELLEQVRELKDVKRGRLSELEGQHKGVAYHAGKRPWSVECDVAMPCATQNELEEKDAKNLVENGVRAIAEGANMPTTASAALVFEKADVLHAPGKASNAGGVAVSGLEQSQNAMRLSWSREEVDERLQQIMRDIHDRCVDSGSQDGRVSYVDGANISGFKKVADAMLAAGIV
jgi:glutamate dehydrogenase (NADP+)